MWKTPMTFSARTIEMAVQYVQPEEFTQLWEQVLLSVRDRLGSQQAFDTWFRPIVPREMSPQSVELEVPNAFFVDWIHEHHLPTPRQGFTDILGQSPEFRFAAREPDPSPAPANAPRPSEDIVAPATTGSFVASSRATSAAA